MNLADYIRDKKIIFTNNETPLDTSLKDYGTYEHKLIKHLLKQSGEYLTIRGKCLKKYLTKPEHLHKFTDFLLTFIAFLTPEQPTISIHVRVPLEALEPYYPQTGTLENLTQTASIDTSHWLPHLSCFEKQWNLALCEAFGCFVGSGYEWPQNEEEFQDHIAYHAQLFLIGTPEELDRYWAYRDFTEDDATKQGIERILTGFGRSQPS